MYSFENSVALSHRLDDEETERRNARTEQRQTRLEKEGSDVVAPRKRTIQPRSCAFLNRNYIQLNKKSLRKGGLRAMRRVFPSQDRTNWKLFRYFVEVFECTQNIVWLGLVTRKDVEKEITVELKLSQTCASKNLFLKIRFTKHYPLNPPKITLLNGKSFKQFFFEQVQPRKDDFFPFLPENHSPTNTIVQTLNQIRNYLSNLKNTRRRRGYFLAVETLLKRHKEAKNRLLFQPGGEGAKKAASSFRAIQRKLGM